MIKKAIIPAAGYGTRSLPISKVIPKEMFPIGFSPAIEYIVNEAISSGIEKILMIVSRSKNLIIDYFDHSLELEMFLEKMNKTSLLQKLKMPDVQILYTRQPFAKGLGDAIRLGKDFVGNDPFAVLLPDDIIIQKKGTSLSELIDVYQQYKYSVIGLQEVNSELLKNYGVIEGQKIEEKLYQLQNIIEKPLKNPPSNLAVIGRYIFTPEIMKCLEQQAPGIQGEIQLTDSIRDLLNYEMCYGKIISGSRYDIGSLTEYVALLNRLFGQD